MKGMVNAAQLAEALGVSRPTLRRWVAAGTIPKPHATLGHTKLWNEQWLRQSLSSQRFDAEQAEVRAKQAEANAKVQAERDAEKARLGKEYDRLARTNPELAEMLFGARL